MTLKFEWTKSRSRKPQQNLRGPLKTNLKAKVYLHVTYLGTVKILSDLEQEKSRSGLQGKVAVQEISPRSFLMQGIKYVPIYETENELQPKG